MPPLPQAIPIPPEVAIASFSFTDIAEGTGITNFFGMNTQNDAGVDHSLSQTAYFSDDIFTVAAGTAATASTKLLDLDFNLSAFNLPKIVKGTATFSVSWGFIAGGFLYEAFIIARVKKNDVEIASVQSETINGVSAGKGGNVTLMQVVLPQTHYKKGEVLRVTMELWAKKLSGSGANGLFYIFHDPKARTDAAATTIGLETTISQMGIPFRIDL